MKTRGSLVVMLVAAFVATGCSRSGKSEWAASGGVHTVQTRLEARGGAREASGAGVVGTPAAAAAPQGSAPAPSAPAREAGASAKQAGAPRASDPDAKLEVKRLVLAKSVSGRAPVGAGERFVVGEQERIYAFVELANAGQSPSEISVSFEREGGPSFGDVKLDVGAAPRWRTWAFTRQAKKAGTYVATVRNARGVVLAKQSFAVEAAPAKASAPNS